MTHKKGNLAASCQKMLVDVLIESSNIIICITNISLLFT